MTLPQRMIKRIFDILVALIGIKVLLGVFVIIAITVKLTSRGPVFFIQKRVGRHGKLFRCIKFRTMYTGAEKHGSITTAADIRITPVGRVLRRFKLDELPQLWNVLIGNMSFVGPRPDVPGYADRLQGDDRRILDLRPGITGPATLAFRNEEELLSQQADPKKYNDEVIWPEKVRINLAYQNEWSFGKDIGIIIRTIVPGLKYKNQGSRSHPLNPPEGDF